MDSSSAASDTASLADSMASTLVMSDDASCRTESVASTLALDSVNTNSSKRTLKSRLGSVLRTKSSGRRLVKKPPPGWAVPVVGDNGAIISSDLKAHQDRYRKGSLEIDKTTGERKDTTNLMHSMVHRVDSTETIRQFARKSDEFRKPGEPSIASLSPDLWQLVADYMTPADAARLALASKYLASCVGSSVWGALNLPENISDRIEFLVSLDEFLPDHLFCFICATYHLRTQKGQERLAPPGEVNFLFRCPHAYNNNLPAPRARITPGRHLPFALAQLSLRAEKFTPEYGLPVEMLGRRWKQGDWRHYSRFTIIKGHLYMRVVSSTYTTPDLTPAGERLLLYSREDYTPYFSACAHWQNGVLMSLCKCAMSHIPKPRFNGGYHKVSNKAIDMMSDTGRFRPLAPTQQCEECRPMRRCPDCPTEYLIEIRLAEDKIEKSFKRAIVVTRWSDLGDGTTPLALEWGACTGRPVEYDSFAKIGRRAISGTFESYYTEDHIPGQRIMSMNPKKERKGEAGNDWY